MQSVVRSSFVGLLAIAGLTAGLTACGDKTTVTGTATDTTIHQVVVTPQAVTNLQVGGTFTLAASVDAGSGAKDRTVTWSSSDATIASVDAATGKVTGVKVGGPITITAASHQDPTVKGAAVITVVPAGGTSVPLVTISTINQTVCGLGGCNSVPANLLNVAGQVDVTINVDAGTNTLSKITGMIKCGNDSVQVVQNIAAANVAPSADEAASPVTLNFNTAAFNATTGVPALHNGQCTVSAFATTTGGQQSAVNTTTFTLNNGDMGVVTVSSTNSATDNLNKPWIGGGPLTISVLPVMYSGRTPVAASIGLNTGVGTTGSAAPNPTTQTLTSLSSGVFSATWTNGPTAPSVQNYAATGASPTISISDNTGAVTNTIGSVTVKGGTTTTTPANFQFNFDDQKPAPGTFSVINNPDQNIAAGGLGYVGAPFRFVGDSASGYRGANAIAGNQTQNTDNGGVDKVTVAFQFRTNGSGTYATVTNTTPIAESATAQAYELRMITADALGNADTTGNASSAQPTTIKFGVDKTAPSETVAAAPANQATTIVANGNGSYNFTITDALSGIGPALVAQARNWNGLSTVNSANEGRINTNVAAPPGATYFAPNTSASGNNPCSIGRFNATQAASGANAIALFNAAGTAIGFCTPVVFTLTGNSLLPATFGQDGYWTTTVVAQDVAGNQTAPVTRTVLEDVVAPTVVNIDLPPTATGNATVSFPASVTDNTASGVGDITGSFITQVFPAASLRWPTGTGPGTAFDNVLTNNTTVTPSIPNFIKNLQVAAVAAAPVAGNNVTGVSVTALGAAGNQGTLSATFAPGLPQLVAGSTTTFSATGNCVVSGTGTCPSVSGWAIQAPTNANISNCPNDACTPAATQPTSITLTVTAQGLTQIYTNPFATGTVEFWYRPTGNAVWYLIGNSAAGVSRDNNVNRFWDFTISFNPPNFTPDQVSLTTNGMTIDVMAVGVNAAGDAVATATTVLTVANP
jgi:hypothetical protein